MVDLKRFVVGKELLPGTLWVAEQIPGLVEASDMTDTLLRGYWPSYNVPYFEEVMCPVLFVLDLEATCRWNCGPVSARPVHIHIMSLL